MLPANRLTRCHRSGSRRCRFPDIQKGLHDVMATPSESPRATEEIEADVPTPENENEQQTEGGETMNRDELHGYDFEVRFTCVCTE